MPAGAFHGYFRDDALTAKNHVATRLPYSEPADRGSARRTDREGQVVPGRILRPSISRRVVFRPSNLPNQSFAYRNGQKPWFPCSRRP